MVRIYDLRGQPVRTLDLGHLKAGRYLDRDQAIHWDGRTDKGELIASGVYFYTIQAGQYTQTHRMVILK